MNRVIISGRLTKEPELKQVGDVSNCSFAVAVDRKYKNKDGVREADFFNCVAWRYQADFLARYFHKGSKLMLEGTLQSRSYEKNGQTVYVTEIVAEHIEFAESAPQKTVASTAPTAPATAPAEAPAVPAAPAPVDAPPEEFGAEDLPFEP